MSKSGNFFALLEKKLKAAGDAPAFETADGAILTFAELLDEVGRAAAALISLGVKPGDRVLVQAEKSLPNVFLYLATLKVGAVPAIDALDRLDDVFAALLDVIVGPDRHRLDLLLGAYHVLERGTELHGKSTVRDKDNANH
jgi:AMP-binding enzyme